MEVACSMLDCTNNPNTTFFFAFPKDFHLCMLWVYNSGRSDLITDFTYEGVKPFLNRHICSEHFRVEDFIDHHCYSKGLNASAVPVAARNFSEHNNDQAESFGTSEISQLVLKQEIVDYQNSIRRNDCIEKPASEMVTAKLITEAATNHVIIKEEQFDDSNSTTDCNYLDECFNRDQSYTNESNIFNSLTETSEQNTLRSQTNALRNAIRRANETPQQRQDRLYKNALRSAMKRSMETTEEQLERRRKNALRVAFVRKTESDEKRKQRLLKDRLRSALRRKNETTEQSQYRHYVDAVRAAFRRYNETDEQREQRRKADIIRAAKRKRNETEEERSLRLEQDRERSARRRMLKKVADNIDQWCHIDDNSTNTQSTGLNNSAEYSNSESDNTLTDNSSIIVSLDKLNKMV